MKKALLALFAVLMAFAASAANQYTCQPAEGTIGLGANPGGIGSIEIDCTGEINRNCMGLATLSKGTNVLKAIPASNKRMVYCIDGYDKGEILGTPHITFFTKNDSPATEPGNYTVVIPPNYFTVNGVGNSQLVYHFTIAGDGVKFDFSPAKFTTIEKLTEVKITFNGAESVTSINTASIFMDYPDPNNDPNDENATDQLISVYASGSRIEGNTAIIEFPEYDTNGVISINIPSGAIKYQVAGKTQQGSLPEQLYTYTIAPSLEGTSFTLSPSTATFTGALKPYERVEIPSETEGANPTVRYNYFNLKAPTGYKFGMLASRRTGLQLEQPDGSLKATSIYFNNWVANEEKTEAAMYLTGDYDDPAKNAEVVIAPGTYYLVIPAKSFQAYAPGSDIATMYQEELKFGPFIVEGEPAKYTVTPAADKEVTELSEIRITFEEGVNLEVNKIGWFTLMDGAIEYDLRGKAEGNEVVITINPPLTTTGVYDLISEGSNILVNGMETPVEAQFTVVRSFINEISLMCNGEPIEAKIEDYEDFGDIWVANAVTPDMETPFAAITFALPYGYDSVYAMEEAISQDSRRRIPVSELEAGNMKKLVDNTIELPVGEHHLYFTYATAEGEALDPTGLIINVLLSDKTSLIESVALECNGENIEVKYTEIDDELAIWETSVKAYDNFGDSTALPSEYTADITFKLPEGYDSVYAMDYGIMPFNGRRMPVSDLTAGGMSKLPNNTLYGLEVGRHTLLFSYANGDKALTPAIIVITVTEPELSGVAEVEVAEDAEYFTLQGVKVANPEKGIYIKIANGKASKVNVK